MLKFERKIIITRLFFFCVLMSSLIYFAGCSMDKSSKKGIRLDKGESISLYRNIPVDDPNRDPNWKWFEYKENGYTMYARVGSSNSDIKTIENKQLPFFRDEGPAAKHLFYMDQSKVDMHPEKGWVLLLRDFGTESNAPPLPFFVLYNQARGVLRYFFYNARISNDYTYALARLKFQNIDNANSALSFDAQDKAFWSEYDKNYEMVSITKMEFSQWSYADFQVGYDPNIKDNTMLWFDLRGVKESEITLKGDIALTQVLEEQNLSTSAFDNIIPAVMSGYSYYKNSQSAITGLKNQALKNPDAWYSGLIMNLAVGTPLSQYGPAIAGLAGGLFTLFGSSDQSAPVPLKFEGTIELDGTVTLEQPIFSLGMKIPGANYYNNADDYHIPLNHDVPLGVFMLKKRPKLGWRKGRIWSSGESDYFKIAADLTQPLEFIINPNISGYKLKTVEVSYVCSDKEIEFENSFEEINQFYANHNFYTDTLFLNVCDKYKMGRAKDITIRLNNGALATLNGYYGACYGAECNSDDLNMYIGGSAGNGDKEKVDIAVKVILEPIKVDVNDSREDVTLIKVYNPEYVKDPHRNIPCVEGSNLPEGHCLEFCH